MLSIPLQKMSSEVITPTYAVEGSSGVDLHALTSVCLKKGTFSLIPTGLKIALQDGYEAQVRPRSGLAAKHGITVLNAPGTIDASYRGEIKVLLINHGEEDFQIEKGMRIAQLVVAKVEHITFKVVQDLPSSIRGEGGFGSTGV